MKMFCFPHAGGFANYYNFLKKAKYDVIDNVYLYEYYGRNQKSNRACPITFENFTDIIIDFVHSHLHQNEKFVFFGHSMGAFVAYETAVKLKKQGFYVPETIFLSGQRPPCTIEKGYFSSNPDIAIPYLKRLGGMNELWNTDEAVKNYFLPIILGDLKLLESYTPTIPDESERLENCILLYGNTDIELEKRNMQLWKNHFVNIKKEYVFNGDHFYLKNYQKQLVNIINNETKGTTL